MWIFRLTDVSSIGERRSPPHCLLGCPVDHILCAFIGSPWMPPPWTHPQLPGPTAVLCVLRGPAALPLFSEETPTPSDPLQTHCLPAPEPRGHLALCLGFTPGCDPPGLALFYEPLLVSLPARSGGGPLLFLSHVLSPLHPSWLHCGVLTAVKHHPRPLLGSLMAWGTTGQPYPAVNAPVLPTGKSAQPAS